ncbi:MAG: amino acid racemase [Spirochaetaceae bacterium]|nr:amino acid racemase [Spirochaetaceae bacterium]
MRIIGIIGGMSWESTAEYYRLINEEVGRRLGGLSSGRILLSSVDFAPFAERMNRGEWGAIGEELAGEARRLKAAGAEALLVATNTMHRFAAEIESDSGLPLIHIADAAAAAIGAAGKRKVGLLGTRYTMEGDFYRGRLLDRHGIETLVPEEADRAETNRVIFEELCRGVFKPESKTYLLGLAESLAAAGAEGVILGCTELPLVMKEGEASVPLWDTTLLHALAAVDFMLGEGALPAGTRLDAALPVELAEAAETPEAEPAPAAVWGAFLAGLPWALRDAASARGYRAWHFCADEKNADELGRLVLAGKKRATASSLRAVEAEGEALPSPGDYSVITDWKGRGLCVIETTKVEVKSFGRVDAEFAAREGEGDGSLAFWRSAHREAFGAEHAALGLPFGEATPVVLEDFEVVFRPADA